MCGRAAQSVGAVNAAGQLLTGGGRGGNIRRLRGGGDNDSSRQDDPQQNDSGNNDDDDNNTEPTSFDCSMPLALEEEDAEENGKEDGGKTTSTTTVKDSDNMNMCPGMLASVFCSGGCSVRAEGEALSSSAGDDSADFALSDMFWGLVPRPGTPSSPLPVGNLSLHFEMLMYNARSDTLMDKRTFRDLVLKRQSCIVAVDGYYEWKEPRADTYDTSKTKQPYYVCRSDGQPLLIAGLWTSVPTGRPLTDDGAAGKREMLSTFTMITTDACSKIQTLHHRMPVLVWSVDLARQWLSYPTRELHNQLSRLSSTTNAPELHFYPVTKQMTSLKFRNYEECIKEIPLRTIASVKSFFTTKMISNAPRNKQPTSPALEPRASRKRSGSKVEANGDAKKAAARTTTPEKVSSPFQQRSPSRVSSPPPTAKAPASQGTKRKIPTPSKNNKKDITSFFAPRPKK